MVTFEIASTTRSLGAQRIPAGDVEKYRARFNALLDQGVILTAVTATVTSAASTVATPTLSDDKKSVYFLLTAGSLAEAFTLAFQVTTNDGQVLNYSIAYNVDAA